jgi:hypothetical protein
VNWGVLLAALLLAAPPALAGDRVRAPSQANYKQAQPAAAAAGRTPAAPVTISIAVPATPTPGAPDEGYISLRGPDGQTRRFAVEGGREALSSRVVVLRPGDSVTIRLAAGR